MSFNIIYSGRYAIDIGPHVFPTRKYRLVHDRLLESAASPIHPSDVLEPRPASWEQLGLVHTSEYLAKMRDGTMTAEDIAQLELPWSVEMVEGFRLMVGGTVQAACMACGIDVENAQPEAVAEPPQVIRAGIGRKRSAFFAACHIGGGLHHAFPNHGEGFCPFNDVAVAVRVLQANGVNRVAVVDLDVHHGNGTAFIFNPGGAPPTAPSNHDASGRSGQHPADARVFTFSMHQQHNYPMWKPRGSLDIGLSDGAGDATFLEKLRQGLPTVMATQPECIFYLAGADPYECDQLGGLGLTLEGLRQRDRLVIHAARTAGLPLVITLAGGYARNVADTVAIHVATIEEALRAVRVTRSA